MTVVGHGLEAEAELSGGAGAGLKICPNSAAGIDAPCTDIFVLCSGVCLCFRGYLIKIVCLAIQVGAVFCFRIEPPGTDILIRVDGFLTGGVADIGIAGSINHMFTEDCTAARFVFDDNSFDNVFFLRMEEKRVS